MILVFDTSGAQLSIALATDEGVMLREYFSEPDSEESRGIHDAKLALETAKLFSEEGMPISELSRIGLVIGPGSFTGLRIGLTFAKGLAFATGSGIVPIVKHDAMNRMLGGSEGVLVSPGYRPDLFYISETFDPNAIRLAAGPEVLGITGKDIFAHGYFLTHSSSFLPSVAMYVTPSIAVIAEMTTEAFPITDLEIDSLEPLYLTEFNAQRA